MVIAGTQQHKDLQLCQNGLSLLLDQKLPSSGPVGVWTFGLLDFLSLQAGRTRFRPISPVFWNVRINLTGLSWP